MPEWDDDPISKGRHRARVQLTKDAAAKLHTVRTVRDILKLVYAQMYSEGRTREYEEWIETAVKRELATLAARPDGQSLTLPFQGRVIMSTRFNLHRPKSIPKSVTMPLTARGDVDNMAKAVLDALQNAGVLSNDRIVSDLLTYRRYADAEHPIGVEVDLTAVG